MGKPANTTQMVTDNPLRALLMGVPGGIEASEAQGQRELLGSDSLPVATHGGDDQFVALGFTFAQPDESDPLFRSATLPKGWKREGSDHAMWSYLVDERGIRRVAVFYKAAFYDRRADMHVQNVGRTLASTALYADSPPTPATLRLDALTPEELTDMRGEFGRMREDIAKHPDIYGKYAGKLRACEALLPAVSSEASRESTGT